MTRWSDKLASLSKAHQTRRGNKYKAQRCTNANGQSFGSKLERAVHAMLLMRQEAGELDDIRCQVLIELFPGMTHRIDFVAYHCQMGVDIGIEAKGKDDPTWREKRKAYKAMGPMDIEVWGGSHLRPMLIEEIPAGRYKVIER